MKIIDFIFSRYFWISMVLFFLLMWDFFKTFSVFLGLGVRNLSQDQRDFIIEHGDFLTSSIFVEYEKMFFILSLYFSEIFFIIALFILVLFVSILRLAPETIAFAVLAINLTELYLLVLKYTWVDQLKNTLAIFFITENILVVSFEVIIFSFISFLLFLNFLLIKRAEKGYLSEAIQILMLFSVIGMLFFISASDFVVLYLAMELISLCFYVLVASDRNNIKSVEAGIKIFYIRFIFVFFVFIGR